MFYKDGQGAFTFFEYLNYSFILVCFCTVGYNGLENRLRSVPDKDESFLTRLLKITSFGTTHFQNGVRIFLSNFQPEKFRSKIDPARGVRAQYIRKRFFLIRQSALRLS